jgi:sugar phosphate permease
MISEPQLLRKITIRLIPFMFLLYIVAYLDRVNVSYAALQMNAALGFSSQIYAIGAGIFFIGYFLFEVPSNLILHRVGARLWMARILVTWGILSSAMMLVKGIVSFYVLRFLLGIAEAGFFPGMILYLTYWFPSHARGRAVGRFMTATAIAGALAVRSRAPARTEWRAWTRRLAMAVPHRGDTCRHSRCCHARLPAGWTDQSKVAEHGREEMDRRDSRARALANRGTRRSFDA